MPDNAGKVRRPKKILRGLPSSLNSALPMVSAATVRFFTMFCECHGSRLCFLPARGTQPTRRLPFLFRLQLPQVFSSLFLAVLHRVRSLSPPVSRRPLGPTRRILGGGCVVTQRAVDEGDPLSAWLETHPACTCAVVAAASVALTQAVSVQDCLRQSGSRCG